MTLRCRYCKELLILNEDTPESRYLKTDPVQQMRKHIEKNHLPEIMGHSRSTGWLVDRLFFECPDEPERWRENIIRLLDAYLEGKL